jgi:hypothetical protein
MRFVGPVIMFWEHPRIFFGGGGGKLKSILLIFKYFFRILVNIFPASSVTTWRVIILYGEHIRELG